MGGGKGGGGGNQTVTQKADPWSGIQPQLRQAAGDTQNLYNQGLLRPQVYQGQTYAGFSPESLQAMNMTTQRATNGSPINTANSQMLTDTLSGKYLDPNSNPYLKGTYDQASNSVRGSVDSQFGSGGRYGSGLNQQVLGQGLNNLANDIYGGNYQQERTRQMGASALAPQAANQDYVDAQALGQVGAQKEGMAQNEINDTINRFNANAAAPGQNIQNYIGLLNGAGGQYGSTTQTSPYHQNNTLGGIGQGLGLLGSLGGMGGIGNALGMSGMFGTGKNIASTISAMPAIFSDSRLKENIIHMGMENGIPIYHFTYKSDPDHLTYRGVMAQDIVHTHPEAVERIGDYLAVDYEKIGIEFARVH